MSAPFPMPFSGITHFVEVDIDDLSEIVDRLRCHSHNYAIETDCAVAGDEITARIYISEKAAKHCMARIVRDMGRGANGYGMLHG